MLNRDIYLKDPSQTKLENDGVVNVNNENAAVLRYELETFVCDGQYANGMERILDSFIRNIGKNQQPAAWISGFFGSGKSHLAKMLSALWTDYKFSDGATARNIVTLPDSIKAQLVELSTAGKQNGGLHAATGTLNSGVSNSVRLSLLGIVFKSVGLPEDYQCARFVLYLKKEGIYNDVKSNVEAEKNNWEEELSHFRISPPIQKALLKYKSDIFVSSQECSLILKNQYPGKISDIPTEEMVQAINQALSHDNKIPLTLIVLDEIQQFISTDDKRSMEVQTVVEACCTQFQNRLLFVGTGQTAITGTSYLQRLQGRFTVRVELSENDVGEVIRKVILQKKPDARSAIEAMMKQNIGEISKHLSGSRIAPTSRDEDFFVSDYPILPSRHRFWEHTLQSLDRTGTNSQLRSQLHMIHKAIQTNLDKPLANVIPADFLYFNLGSILLGNGILPSNLWQKTLEWIEKGTDDEKLMARACGLIFLIRKISEFNKELGIKANNDTLAHLMVEDISVGSGKLASILQSLLTDCELVMQIDDEYHIQTPESIAWNTEFSGEVANFTNNSQIIAIKREELIRAKFNEQFRVLTKNQGDSNVPRKYNIVFDTQLPSGSEDTLTVWVRNGWDADSRDIISDARMQPTDSPVIFVFIPSRSEEELRQNLIHINAATAVLNSKGIPTTQAGDQARMGIETIRRTAERKVEALLVDAVTNAKVYQSGGNEISGRDLKSKIEAAAGVSLQRLFPQFVIADDPRWDKVYDKARQGSPEALRAISYMGEVIDNPVCKEIYTYIGTGKKGVDIRQHFMGKPYGWSQDAVDGSLLILLVTGIIKSQNDQLEIVEPKQLERRDIPKTLFRVETININAIQRIKIREPLQKAGVHFRPNEEQAAIPAFIEKLRDLCDQVGGEAPLPLPPDNKIIEDIRTKSGNEQLLFIHDNADDLCKLLETWEKTADRIKKRIPAWTLLSRLISLSKGVDITNIQQQFDAIIANRQLLNSPDSIQPLLVELTQRLRDKLNIYSSEYDSTYKNCWDRIKNDTDWRRLMPDKQDCYLDNYQLSYKSKPAIDVSSSDTILSTLEKMNFSALQDRIDSLPLKFDKVLGDVVKFFEPKVQEISLASGTLKSEDELEKWLAETKATILAALKNGPVLIR